MLSKCPGRHLADTNFWIAVATILALFKIEKVKNENGEDIIPQVHMQTGLTRYGVTGHGNDCTLTDTN
jgi:alanine racemase